MFDIGWSEMAVIMLVALIVIGPRDLPRVARNVGRWVAKGRALAREFQHQLEDMAREAELDKVKQEIERAGRTDLGKTIERSIDPKGELGRAFDPAAEGDGKEPARAAPPAGAGTHPQAQEEALPRTPPAARDTTRAEPERAPAEPT